MWTSQEKTNQHNYELIESPCELILDLEQIKKHLNDLPACDGSEDVYLTKVANAAISYAEKITELDLATKTYRLYLDHFGSHHHHHNNCINIFKRRNVEILSVEFLLDGELQTVDNNNYFVTFSNDYPQLCLVDDFCFPDHDNRKQAIQIKFKAGFGDKSCNIPSDLCQAIFEHIAQMFTNRGDCEECDCDGNLPSNTKMIYQAYKPLTLTTCQYNF